MKKNGRKWRKEQKEKEERRVIAKQTAVEPFSRERKRKHLCLHYDGIPGGIVAGYCYSLLVPINENECQCRQCGKSFSIDKYSQMENLVDYLSNKGCVTDIKLIEKLSEGLDPVYYRRLSETETEILEELNDKVCLPRHTTIIS